MSGRRARYVGLDLSRGIALVGMLIAHAAPLDGLWGGLHLAASDRSRMLFAIVAGAGLALFVGEPRPSAKDRAEARRLIAVRALCLMLLGLTLTAAGPPISVILDEYAIAFVLTLPLLFASRRVLLVVGVTGLTTLPALCAMLAGAFEAAGPTAFAAPALLGLLSEWAFAGSYPVLVWAAALLTGMGIARGGLPSRRARAWIIPLLLVLGAAPLALRRWSGDALPLPAQVASLTVSSAALSVVILLTAVWAADLTARRTRRAVRFVTAPVAAMGTMPLTMYIAQALVLLIWQRGGRAMPGDVLIVLTLLFSAVFALAWRRLLHRRGPAEGLIALLAGRGATQGSRYARHPRASERSPSTPTIDPSPSTAAATTPRETAR